MSATKLADEYDAIRQRLAEIEREKTAALNAEMPKAWPSYAAVDQDYSGQEVFVPYDYDPA